MRSRAVLRSGLLLASILLLGACYPNPSPPGLTPIPTLAPASPLTPVGSVAGQATAPAASLPTPGATTPATAGQGTVAPQPTAASGGGANVAQGQQTFATSCSPCHGPNGQGGGIGPKLAGDAFITSGDQAVFNTIANGRPGTAMPAWSTAKGGSLSDAQINAVIAYLKSLQ